MATAHMADLKRQPCYVCGKQGIHRTCESCSLAYHVHCGHACPAVQKVAATDLKCQPCYVCGKYGIHRVCERCSVAFHVRCGHVCPAGQRQSAAPIGHRQKRCLQEDDGNGTRRPEKRAKIAKAGPKKEAPGESEEPFVLESADTEQFVGHDDALETADTAWAAASAPLPTPKRAPTSSSARNAKAGPAQRKVGRDPAQRPRTRAKIATKGPQKQHRQLPKPRSPMPRRRGTLKNAWRRRCPPAQPPHPVKKRLSAVPCMRAVQPPRNSCLPRSPMLAVESGETKALLPQGLTDKEVVVRMWHEAGAVARPRPTPPAKRWRPLVRPQPSGVAPGPAPATGSGSGGAVAVGGGSRPHVPEEANPVRPSPAPVAPDQPPVKGEFSEDERRTCMELYHRGFTAAEITDQLHCAVQSVSHRQGYLRLPAHRRREGTGRTPVAVPALAPGPDVCAAQVDGAVRPAAKGRAGARRPAAPGSPILPPGAGDPRGGEGPRREGAFTDAEKLVFMELRERGLRCPEIAQRMRRQLKSITNHAYYFLRRKARIAAAKAAGTPARRPRPRVRGPAAVPQRAPLPAATMAPAEGADVPAAEWRAVFELLSLGHFLKQLPPGPRPETCECPPDGDCGAECLARQMHYECDAAGCKRPRCANRTIQREERCGVLEKRLQVGPTPVAQARPRSGTPLVRRGFRAQVGACGYTRQLFSPQDPGECIHGLPIVRKWVAPGVSPAGKGGEGSMNECKWMMEHELRGNGARCFPWVRRIETTLGVGQSICREEGSGR